MTQAAPIEPPPNLPDAYRLPPLGSIARIDMSFATSFIDGLVYESSLRRQPLEIQADMNLNMFLGYHWTTAAPDFVERLTVNRILNAVIAQVAVQSEQTPKVKFTPRESLEPPTYYINTTLDATPTPELQALLAQLPEETRQPYETVDENGETVINLPRKLEPSEVQFVEQAINQASIMAGQLGQETTIPAEVLIGVNDRICAEALQTVFDAKWDECDADFKVSENILYTGIVGWQWLMYEWDDDTNGHVLKNVPFLQVHVDPLCTDIRDAQYLIFDQILPADEAVALFPDLEQEIRKFATPGVIRPAGVQYRQASVYGQTNWSRNMITHRRAYLRNSPVPLSVDEAVERGLVIVTTTEEEKPMECTCGAGVSSVIDNHAEGCPCREGYAGPSVETLADKADSMDMGSLNEAPEAGEGEQASGEAAPVKSVSTSNQGQMLPPATRKTSKTTYKLKDGEPTAPDAGNWPTRPILRQLSIIVNHVVDDRECEHIDIPMALNINIPIMYSPYGMGEPERLRGLQQALNSVLSDMVTHWHFHAQPAEFIDELVNNALPAYAQKSYTAAPGTKFIVPHDLMLQLQGRLGFYLDPPKIPTDGWQLISLLIKLMDDESQNAEVLQGKASAGWSGEAIQALQKAAKGSIGWKSRRTEYALRYLANLMVHPIIHRMPLEEKMRYCSKFPIQCWYAIDERLKKGVEVDIAVEIASGSGARKQMQAATDLQLFDRKLLSAQTTLESSGHDPKIELNQQLAWQREINNSQQQLPQGQQMPAPQQQPQAEQAPQEQPQPQ